MNAKLQEQKLHLQKALHLANMIEDFDRNIEVGRHVNYFKGCRTEALEAYGDVIGEIIEGSIDIAVEFNKVESMPFDQKLMQEINAITNDYRLANNL